MSISKPAWRSAARSAMVALEPGRMTRSASPGSALPGRTRTSSTRRLGVERIEIVEIGDMRQQRNGDLDARSVLDGPRSVQRQRILSRQQPRLGEEGNEAERLPAGRRRDQRHAIGEQRRVAAELVDEEALDQRRVVGVDHRLGADQAGDHAAAVDVADQHHRHVGGAGEAHIGDVVGAQIDLGRAARAFDQHDVGFALQPREAVQHERHQLRLDRLIIGCARASIDFALHHELRADLALRLEQHRVHMHGGRDARGARLQRLGAADLAAVLRHRCVVRHVLRLERQHLQPARDERRGRARRRSATCRRRSPCLGT